ncbi:hypothetical protein [Pedobacter endophyticus]|uniref:DUF2490 domain-containing protein n=1 Tax=Pedobacter endophyticus TaxID=2789740 RepID=A0A7S9PZ54_9SPHI|nr:hypothetical protein [Pedobacter endophyticus]QPH39351.1 hypothetical protein IZT61_20290 [Pedobacter endophyticus]
MKTILISILMICCSLTLHAQEEDKDEFFQEAEAAYTYVNNNKWRGAATANWKHLFDKYNWSRWGMDAYISRKMKFISLEAGITTYYTVDKKTANFLELRPWFGLRSDFELSNRLLLMQKFKIERRHFLYKDDTFADMHTTRTRFLLSLKYDFIKDREDWKLNPTSEWYFVSKNADAERFSNSVEFGLRLLKIFKNEHELAVGYKRESYKSEYISEDKHGHIFLLEYAF